MFRQVLSSLIALTAAVVAQAPQGGPGCSLVENGDFEAGNVGFTSTATYVATGPFMSTGQYSVRTDPSTANGNWCGVDHTTSAGKFLICDGVAGVETVAWRQTIAVEDGATYALTAWVNNLSCMSDFADPVIELRADSRRVAGPLTVSELPDRWVGISGEFTACASTVLLEIVSTSTAFSGDDFGIDDVRLDKQLNLVVNGNFEAGNTGFTSTATYVPSGQFSAPGQYAVRTDASTANPSFCESDHTCGTGRFLICDGTPGIATCAWRQSVAVCPGREYTFSAWVNNVTCVGDGPDPRMQLRIDGTVVTPTTPIPEMPNEWVRLSHTFTPSSSPVLLEVCSVATTLAGNDFAVDDVSLTRAVNLVANGDFEAGNVGFTSNATFVASGVFGIEGTYSVRTDPSSANSNWCGGDHSTGASNMLMCDGNSGAPTIAWEQTVVVCPGESHVFSAWVDNANCPPVDLFVDPRLELRVNGSVLAGPPQLPESPDRWVLLAGVYVVPAGTTNAVLQIVATSTAFVGNDFLIDDVGLTPLCCQSTGSIVSIPACPAGYHGLGGPVLSFSGSASFGETLTIMGSNLSGSPACALLLGFGSLPIPLSVIGSTVPGSSLCVAPFVTLPCGGSGSANVPLRIGNDPGTCGLGIHVQWIDYAGTGLDFGTSRAARFTVGV